MVFKVKSQFLKILVAFSFATFFLLQPMVVYLTSYDPGDCDDKAVHYFSAAYFMASSDKRQRLESILNSIKKEAQIESFGERTDFRLRSVNNYALANLTIATFHRIKPEFNNSVKYGLATVTLIALVVAVLLSSKTPFGYWQSVFVVNLIAFYSIKINFIVSQIPRNMHPFISYVPRGGGALLVLPIVLAFAAKKPLLMLVSLIFIFLIHTGLGVIIFPLVFLSWLVLLVIHKYKLAQNPFSYLPLLVMVLTGLPTFIASVSLGLLFYVFSKKVKAANSDFYNRIFEFGTIMLAVTIISVGIITNSLFTKSLSNFLGASIMQELPQRFGGIKYVLAVLLTVVSIRLFYNFLVERKYFVVKAKVKYLSLTGLIIIALSFLTLNHLSEYQWIMKKSTGFFYGSCQTVFLDLSKNSHQLKVESGPVVFFTSLGNYLFEGENNIN